METEKMKQSLVNFIHLLPQYKRENIGDILLKYDEQMNVELVLERLSLSVSKGTGARSSKIMQGLLQTRRLQGRKLVHKTHLPKGRRFAKL